MAHAEVVAGMSRPVDKSMKNARIESELALFVSVQKCMDKAGLKAKDVSPSPCLFRTCFLPVEPSKNIFDQGRHTSTKGRLDVKHMQHYSLCFSLSSGVTACLLFSIQCCHWFVWKC